MLSFRTRVRTAPERQEASPARNLLAIARAINFNPWHFLIPAGFAVLAAGSEAACALMLIPTLQVLVGTVEPLPPILDMLLHLVSPSGLPGHQTLVGLLCILTSFFALLKIALVYASLSSSVKLTFDFTSRLQITLFSLLGRFENRFFQESRQSDLAYFLHSFPDRLALQIRPLHRTISNLIMCASYGAVLFYLSWKLSIVCSILFLGYQKVMVTALRRLTQRARNAETARSHIGAQVARLMSCYNLMKLLGESDAETEKFAKLSTSYSQESSHLGKWQELINPLFDGMSIVMAIAILYCAQFLWGGLTSTSLPQFLVYVFILRRANASAISVRELQANWIAVNTSLREISQLFRSAPSYLLISGEKKFDGELKEIVVENIHFSYGTGRALLDGVSFTVPQGAHVAVVGPSGSGKSTLAQLFVRLWSADEGRILVDGVDIREFEIASLRRNFAMVSQDTSEVFAGTIRENLLYGLHAEVTDEQIYEMLDALGLRQRISALPLKLETPVTEKGVTLSGGERQLLSLARALLRRSPVYILDEVTSSLDPDTAHRVTVALRRFAADATIIEVTHRLARAAIADQILLLADGKLEKVGSAAQLHDGHGNFRKLFSDDVNSC